MSGSVPYFFGARPTFTLKQRLILGTIISVAVSAASVMLSLPPVAIDSSTYATVAQAETLAVSVDTTGQATSNTEAIVRAYWKDIPVMAEVAGCESQFKQFEADGSVMRGWANSNDLGVMQINERYHAATAQKLGLDLHTLEDNLAFARYLYEREGTRPWKASEFCWGRKAVAYR